jgi:hypothetical protein
MARARALQAVPELPVQEWAEGLSDNFLLCRDIGHSWRPFRAAIGVDGYERVMRCQRCRTERSQWLSLAGHVQASSYNYPEGYQAPKGTGYLASEQRDGLRLESVLRLIAKE